MNELTLKSNANRLHLNLLSTHISETVTEYHYKYSYDPSSIIALDFIPQLCLTDTPLIHLYTLIDAKGIVGRWQPDSHLNKQLTGDWADISETNLSHSAPVVCFFDASDNNILTIAVNEVSKDTHILAGVHEESGEINLHLIVHLSEPVTAGILKVRLDFRTLPMDSVLQDVSLWWDSVLPDPPANVPSCARFPMYSTWYSYHQDMSDKIMLEEYKKAAQLGMKAVIIDDGWQTSDSNRGYGYCGDWMPSPEKFPDFPRHIQDIHQLGMKCILWYSVPFVGEYSGKWEEFRHMLLHYDSVLHTGILDPRYPEVRKYLVSVYQTAYRDWNLDGFKLDFIDSFHRYADTPIWNKNMDFHEIQDAVYCLMIEIQRTLTKKNPDLLIEFRQSYIGPQMRRFGNMFRVADCPLSPVSNRVAIADLRLLSGSTAVHSDMIMWSPEESPENIGIQLINCIFATLQISMKTANLKENQLRTLKHYLQFAVQYQDTLLTGAFSVRNPLGQYPALYACKNNICIYAVYDSRQIAELPDSAQKEYWILNGTTGNHLYISLPGILTGKLTVFNCCGTVIYTESPFKLNGIMYLTVPAGGSLQYKVL